MAKHWTTCRVCGKATKHPDGRGLHKHVRDAHGYSAWAYYLLHLGALRERIEEGVIRVVKREPLGECWEWPGRSLKGRTSSGYKTMRVAGAPTAMTHRLSVAAFFGSLPADGEVVLHECDNPACCNPAHLRCGTHTENMRARQTKQRQCRGLAHPRALLDAQQVIEARQMKEWATTRQIADRLGVSLGVARRAAARLTYLDVPDPVIPF